MKTFDDWWSEFIFGIANQLLYPAETYNNEEFDIKKAMRQAYESGWNACRDQWGGMEYKETIKWK